MEPLHRSVNSNFISAPASDEAALASRVRTIAWCVLLLAGLTEAIVSRHAMQDDGISYLDMGDAMVRGDRKMAFNGVWSPLYPFLQGAAHRLLNPGAYGNSRLFMA